MDTIINTNKPQANEPREPEKKPKTWLWVTFAALLAAAGATALVLLALNGQSKHKSSDDDEDDDTELLDGSDWGEDNPPIQSAIDELADNMVRVEGGTYIMGNDVAEACNGESYEHEVSVSSFYVSRYLVTQRLWEEVMDNNPSQFDDDPNKPVENVSWKDTQNFIRKLNRATGENYRLLTEAEWEFAARGGNRSRGYLYAGSNDLDEVGWYKGNADAQTHSVGLKKANELGLYDMSGNVWEWCQDYFDTSYGGSEGLDPTGPATSDERVLRGGSWLLDDNWGHRVSCRCGKDPEGASNHIGFRLGKSAE